MIYFAMGNKGIYHAYFAFRRTACRPLEADVVAVSEPVTMVPPGEALCSQCTDWIVRSGLPIARFIGDGITLQGAAL